MTDTATRLAGIDHFSQLDADTLEALIDGSELTDYPKGATILDPAAPRAGYSFLIEGAWWMRRDMIGAASPFEWTDDRPGNWHGGVALYDAIAPVTVRATAPSTVLHVPRALLERLAAGNPHLALAMLRGVQGGGTVLYRHATEDAAPTAPEGPATGLTS